MLQKLTIMETFGIIEIIRIAMNLFEIILNPILVLVFKIL